MPLGSTVSSAGQVRVARGSQRSEAPIGRLWRCARGCFTGTAALTCLTMLLLATPASAGPITTVSAACRGGNAEVEQAADRALGYVYELWMGCGPAGIGFARSTDGARRFGR